MSNSLPRNARAIEKITPKDKRVNYSIQGEPGLRLVVHPTGKRVWYAVYQVGKGADRKRRMKELAAKTLQEACQENGAIQSTASLGDDPKPAQGPPGTTFGDLFNAWLEQHAKKKLDAWEDEERRYRLHLSEALATRPVEAIERKDIREIRDTVAENAGPIQSNRTLALFNRVMNWAVDEDRAKFNPAARLRKVGEESRRERVLSEAELRRIWSALSSPLVVEREGTKGGLNDADRDAAIAVRRAIKLLIVTGQRRGEVIGIAKAELDGATWTIPKDRTKNGLPHRVPLTPLAQSIIEEASNPTPYLFPSHKTDGAIRPDAVTKQLQRMLRKMQPRIEGVGPHDIRRTVGTIMRKLGVSVEDRGHVFNHISGAKGKVTSWNYDAGEHDNEKLAALEKWERELIRIVGLVVGK